MRRIYVAGASIEHERVASFADRLCVNDRYFITYPWWQDVAKAKAEGLSDRDMSKGQRKLQALRDLYEGVLSADVFWLLVPATSSTGAWCELGAALVSAHMADRGLGGGPDPYVVIVSGDIQASIFTSLAHHGFATHDEALAHLLGAQ